MATPGNQDGFTILEMIVALTILALVLGLASQTIVMASRSISVGNSLHEAAIDIQAALAQLESSVGQSEVAASGWIAEKRPLTIGGQKIVALVIEKKDGRPTDSILTFYPERTAVPP